MSHGLPDVTLQSTWHEVLLHSLREVMSEHVITHNPPVTPMVLMVQMAGNALNTFIIYIIKQLLTYVSVDM